MTEVNLLFGPFVYALPLNQKGDKTLESLLSGAHRPGDLNLH